MTGYAHGQWSLLRTSEAEGFGNSLANLCGGRENQTTKNRRPALRGKQLRRT
jgi:hypothetical protein